MHSDPSGAWADPDSTSGPPSSDCALSNSDCLLGGGLGGDAFIHFLLLVCIWRKLRNREDGLHGMHGAGAGRWLDKLQSSRGSLAIGAVMM